MPSGVRDHIETVYNRAMRVAPAFLSSRVDYMRPSLRNSWGGPLNGQRHRQNMVREILQRIRPAQIVETGTYRASTTEFFAHLLDVPIHSSEAMPRYYQYSVRRMRPYPHVKLWNEDSRKVLTRLAADKVNRELRSFFYLDAHWIADLPLAEELQIIAQGWTSAVVLIDDFQVPDDAGYQFDDYGPGMALTEDLLPRALGEWARQYPSISSQHETGSKRGSIVLTSPDLLGVMAGCHTLRFSDTSGRSG